MTGPRLQQDLEQLAVRHGVPGATAAVTVGDRVIEAATGVVSTRSGVALTPETLVMIQSVTKVLTATLVMQLVDERSVRLDDPVRRHLPTFTTADPVASRSVTVRHLLTHTGGFEGDLWTATTAGGDALERFVDDVVARAPQHQRPGARYSYCNAGFGVLGRLVEVVRGTTYDEALRRHLADPLGIDELAFCADEALSQRTAIGHVRDRAGAAWRPVRRWAVMPASNPAAGNRLAMSARGLVAFGRMHLRGGVAPDGRRVLSSRSVELMQERVVAHPAVLGASSAQGLGWQLGAGGVLGHGGDAPGVAAMLRVSPRQGVAVAVLTNADGGGALIQDLLERWCPDGPADEHPAVTVGCEHLDRPRRYLGRYEHRQARIDVTQDGDGALRISSTPQREARAIAAAAGTGARVRRARLHHLDDEVFEAVNDGDTGDTGRRRVQFLDRDADGRACFLVDGGRAIPRVD